MTRFRSRHQPKELNLDSELVKQRRIERKQQRNKAKEIAMKTRKKRKLELSKNNLFIEYKNKTQSLSISVPIHSNLDIKEPHYQVSTKISSTNSK